MVWRSLISFFFFFNDTATTEIYTLSLHDALPISSACTTSRSTRSGTSTGGRPGKGKRGNGEGAAPVVLSAHLRSEEHTSELQSQSNLVCRLLLEKKKNKKHRTFLHHPTRTDSSEY